ncbi:MAG: hypothetical protein RTU92_03485 [Candidatus Thorarchaeota archaeon]
MSDFVPFFILVSFIVMVLIISELVDRNRKKHKGDVPSSVYERREKMSPYTMPTGMKVKPGMTYSGNMDYSLPVPESLDDREYSERKED